MEIDIDKIRNYYVDEAGCPTLFGRRGKIIIGEEGCSKYFMMGFVEIFDIIKIESELTDLRKEILADPYFKRVPSVQPDSGKTAVSFHAKDDVAEIRREVFKVILKNDFVFHSEITDKMVVLNRVLKKQAKSSSFRYEDTFLYDSLTSRLFKNHLHKGKEVDIVFAKRGAKPRTEAFRTSIQKSKENFSKKWGIESDIPIKILCSTPAVTIGLQVADYCLWALQRFYEKKEARFLELIWEKVGCIHDIDNRAKSPLGEYYTKKKPLNFSGFNERRI